MQRARSANWWAITAGILVYAMAALYAMAATTKVLKYGVYHSYLHESGLMGEAQADWMAVILPLIELTTACLLVYKKVRYVGIGLALALLPAYTYYVHYALRIAPFTPCGCLGAAPISWEGHYLLNALVLLAGMAVVALGYLSKRRKRNIPGR